MWLDTVQIINGSAWLVGCYNNKAEHRVRNLMSCACPCEMVPGIGVEKIRNLYLYEAKSP
jgi:hypothetical protein